MRLYTLGYQRHNWREFLAIYRARDLDAYRAYLDEHRTLLIQLLDLVRAEQAAVPLLLCVCADASSCHRGVLCERLLQLEPALKIVHLPAPCPVCGQRSCIRGPLCQEEAVRR